MRSTNLHEGRADAWNIIVKASRIILSKLGESSQSGYNFGYLQIRKKRGDFI
jgi:hypothetical protein